MCVGCVVVDVDGVWYDWVGVVCGMMKCEW